MSRGKDLRLAFVIPWYGPDLGGGAETLCREWAEQLHRSGWKVEVLTTTIERFTGNWNQSAHGPGERLENEVPVTRFELTPGNHTLFNRLNRKLLERLPITSAEEVAFMREGPNSDALYRHISRHRQEGLFIFIPYPFGTSYYGMQAARDRSLLIPCLHDEAYAQTHPVRQMFTWAAGLIFNSDPERELARRLYPIETVPTAVLGMGLHPELPADEEAFQRRLSFDAPFILSAGRKDATKNTPLLISCFERYKERRPDSNLRLLMIGPGQVEFSHPHIIDLGFLPQEEKYAAFRQTRLLCNPSVNESFSIVLMEAWLSGAPALVNAASPVTSDYVLKSGGGLLFTDYFHFEAGLDFILSREEVARAMGRQGRRFVLRNYSWPVLTARFEEWIEELEDRMGW